MRVRGDETAGDPADVFIEKVDRFEPGGRRSADVDESPVAAGVVRMPDRRAIADGQQAGIFRADFPPTLAAKMFFGALDEMATNWILSRRRYSLESDADRVVDLFLVGARAR